MLVSHQMGRRHPINAMWTFKVPASTEKVGKVGHSAGGTTKAWSSFTPRTRPPCTSACIRNAIPHAVRAWAAEPRPSLARHSLCQ